MKETSTRNQDKRDPIESEFDAITDAACARLSKNERVRRSLPGDGRLKFDRQLPFLCVYRSPVDREDAGTRELVTTEAAYLFASADPHHPGLTTLTTAVRGIMQEHVGTFLFVEIWSSDTLNTMRSLRPTFEIISPDLDALPSTIEVLRHSLKEISVHGRRGTVAERSDEIVGPPNIEPLVPQCSGGANADEAWQQFRESHYHESPTLYYRPLPYHPNLLEIEVFDEEISEKSWGELTKTTSTSSI